VFDDLLSWDKKLCVYHHGFEINPNNQIPFINQHLNGLAAEEIKIVNPQEPLLAEAQHFIKCIKDDLKPNTDGNEGVEVLKIIEQAYTQVTA
jgi:UDP-2-acetamido-3-amino-2,3-dideoxy-glucuronate N-acetyltransferase